MPCAKAEPEIAMSMVAAVNTVLNFTEFSLGYCFMGRVRGLAIVRFLRILPLPNQKLGCVEIVPSYLVRIFRRIVLIAAKGGSVSSQESVKTSVPLKKTKPLTERLFFFALLKILYTHGRRLFLLKHSAIKFPDEFDLTSA